MKPREKRFDLPGVGMRMVKTALAVALSLVLSGLRPGAIPTFSAIAAIICLQASDALGLKNGVDRIIGTLMGAAWGLLALLLTDAVPILGGHPGMALLAGAGLLPVIWLTVLARRSASATIACVTFLSILYSTGLQPPLEYALNRTVDTLLGILVAYVVNGAWLRRHRNTATLYVATYDGVLAAPDGRLSQYTRVNLARLLERGATVTLATHRTPATLLQRVEGIPFTLPFIIMNGAAVFDVAGRSFPFYVPLPRAEALALAKTADSDCAQCYIYTIEHGELHVYASAPRNPYEEDLQHSFERRQQQSLTKGTPGEGAAIICLFIAGAQKDIRAAEQRVRALPQSAGTTIVCNESLYREGDANVEIFSAEAGLDTAARWLQQQEGYTRLVALGSGQADLPLLQTADDALLAGDTARRDLPFPWAGSNAQDAAVKALHRLFYQKRKPHK